MISLAVIGILKRKAHYGLRFTVGIFTILFGIVISYLLLTLGKTDYPIHIKMGFQLLPLWIILYGIYELTNGINLIKGKQT